MCERSIDELAEDLVDDRFVDALLGRAGDLGVALTALHTALGEDPPISRATVSIGS